LVEAPGGVLYGVTSNRGGADGSALGTFYRISATPPDGE
jgi:hypothetical protein